MKVFCPHSREKAFPLMCPPPPSSFPSGRDEEEADPRRGHRGGRRSGHHDGPRRPQRGDPGDHLQPRQHEAGQRLQEHAARAESLQPPGCEEGDVQQAHDVTNATCLTCDAPQIPVYRGCTVPLLGIQRHAGDFHGKDGLGDAPDPDAPGLELLQKRSAAQALIKIANQHPGEVGRRGWDYVTVFPQKLYNILNVYIVCGYLRGATGENSKNK